LKQYKILTQIDNPTDLRKLEERQLPLLCKEVRSFMIDEITKVGGHLGAGLGVVELTVALHYVFNTPQDKIIFDVGHQSYPHKILTERKSKLNTIRQKGGISGFLKMSESVYDAFGVGHASTSISAALGMSVANDILKNELNNSTENKNKFIAVIGDGSLTGGLAYEGLNNAGYLKKDLIVILNDNNISINKNISAFSNYFNEIFSSQRVQYWKDTIWETLGKAGSKGDIIRRLISKAEGSFKSFITPGMLFEAIGFNYFGPINGNNIFKLVKILNNIKKLNGPIFLHIITEKGKGYDLAEKDTYKLHSVESINQTTGLSVNENGNGNDIKYQDVFGNAMLELFKKDNKLVVVSAAMVEGTGLTILAEKFPDRVIDVGIAESHAVTFAAGMATKEITPIVAIYSSFLQRAFDNIIHDCALQKLHIVFAIDRAGIVGEDGATHHGTFDLSYLRIIPNMIVMSPKDDKELCQMLYSAIYDYKNCCVAIRYPRGKVISNYLNYNTANEIAPNIPLGKGEMLKEGKHICIIALGKMVNVANKTADELEKKNIKIGIMNARFVKPLDTELLDKIATQYNNIITIEDGQKQGGFGSAICEYFIEKKYKNNIKIIGIDDHFVEHGQVDLLLEDEGLCVNNLMNICNNLL